MSERRIIEFFPISQIKNNLKHEKNFVIKLAQVNLLEYLINKYSTTTKLLTRMDPRGALEASPPHLQKYTIIILIFNIAIK